MWRGDFLLAREVKKRGEEGARRLPKIYLVASPFSSATVVVGREGKGIKYPGVPGTYRAENYKQFAARPRPRVRQRMQRRSPGKEKDPRTRHEPTHAGTYRRKQEISTLSDVSRRVYVPLFGRQRRQMLRDVGRECFDGRLTLGSTFAVRLSHERFLLAKKRNSRDRRQIWMGTSAQQC